MGQHPLLRLPDAQVKSAQRLARKNLWATGLLTFPLPFVGYLYTRRYGLASITFAIWLVCAAASEERLAALIALFLMVGSTVENLVAVLRVRSHLRGSESLTPYPSAPQDARIELLKLVKHQGEVTLADCVIAIGLPVEEVRSMLVECEQQDLIRSSNRDRDGAVVYRIV
jgi:hypothetical protein